MKDIIKMTYGADDHFTKWIWDDFYFRNTKKWIEKMLWKIQDLMAGWDYRFETVQEVKWYAKNLYQIQNIKWLNINFELIELI